MEYKEINSLLVKYIRERNNPNATGSNTISTHWKLIAELVVPYKYK